MGDKVCVWEYVLWYGVLVVFGFDVKGFFDLEIVEEVEWVGYFFLVKFSVGGGGKGMEVVFDVGGFVFVFVLVCCVVLVVFGDDFLILERLICCLCYIEV